MSSTRSFTSPGIFADAATTTIPPTPIAGVAYRDAVAGTDDVENGWRYGTRVDSKDWNQIMFLLTSLAQMQDKQGLLGWSSGVDYAVPAIVFGSNGLLYFALQASGPSTTPQDPISSPTFWQQYAISGQIVISASGSFSVPMAMQLGYIKPKVTVVAGGGGGGAATSSGTYNAAGGGGGGGGYAIEVVDLTGVTSVAVTIGAGGTAGIAGGAAPGAGGSSSFGAFSSATGGSGGNSAVAGGVTAIVGAGGAGGVGSNGSINARGSGGLPGVASAPTVSLNSVGPGHGGRGYFFGDGGPGVATAGASQALNGNAGAAGGIVIEW